MLTYSQPAQKAYTNPRYSANAGRRRTEVYGDTQVPRRGPLRAEDAGEFLTTRRRRRSRS